MVVCEVREYSGFEFQPGYAFLLHTDGTYFHEAILASFVCHLPEQGIDGNRICGSVGSLQPLVSHVVGYRGKQSALISQSPEEVV